MDRFEGLVWATTRAYRLPHASAADVTQTTWLRLVENLDRIKDPERLGAWLATTARRECLRHIRLRGRELQVEDDSVFEAPTLGMTLYWVNFTGAVINGWWWWWLAPIIVVGILFIALFLISIGLDEIANPPSGRAAQFEPSVPSARLKSSAAT